MYDEFSFDENAKEKNFLEISLTKFSTKTSTRCAQRQLLHWGQLE